MSKAICPICNTELVTGVPRCYETLTEHVFQPNGSLPDKPTLVCQNPLCLTFGRGFWAPLDYEGGFYADRSSGIAARNVPGLLGNIHEDSEKKEAKSPCLEVAYSYENAREVVGNLPLHRLDTFDALRKLIEEITCSNCRGEGVVDETDAYDLRLCCPKCGGSGVGKYRVVVI